MVLSLAAAGWLIGILTVLFMVVCVVLILTVLIQRPQGGGLAGAFGSGAGSGQTAFGTKTGDALTIFTIIVFVLFIGAAIGLNYAARPEEAAQTTPTSGESGTTEQKPAEGQPGDKKPSDTQPTDSKPADSSATPVPPAVVPTTPPAAPEAQPETTPETKPENKPAETPAEKPADPPKQS
ncbi:MAG: preprotein translocase subunit SecG [Phycisphaerales bacterium]|jgi:preprotein translocase subunit SecG|nr:preprotein translocase subunit SecG [Phycisphaerales bacterium]